VDLSRGWIAVVEGLPYILKGVWVTMTVVAGALAVGMTLGILLSIAQVYGNRFLRRIVGVYVWFFRGIPPLVARRMMASILSPTLWMKHAEPCGNS